MWAWNRNTCLAQPLPFSPSPHPPATKEEKPPHSFSSMHTSQPHFTCKVLPPTSLLATITSNMLSWPWGPQGVSVDKE